MKKRVILAIICTLLLVAAGVAILTNTKKVAGPNIEQSSDVAVSGNDKINYAAETIYDGSMVLPAEVFETPFKKTDYYVSNKELASMMSEETLSAFSDSLKADIEAYYTIDYKSIADYADEYMSEEETARIQAIIDTKQIQTAEFVTDKCLLFEDNYRYYIRGVLKLKQTSPEATETSEVVDIPVTFDEVGNAIMGNAPSDAIDVEE